MADPGPDLFFLVVRRPTATGLHAILGICAGGTHSCGTAPWARSRRVATPPSALCCAKTCADAQKDAVQECDPLRIEISI